jgi:YgiT-type zinc finger domain-containing protein
MHCPICRSGETRPGLATFQHEQDGHIVLVRNVPAEVCTQCGEPYFGEETLDALLAVVKRARAAGMEIAIADYTEPVSV